jgi:hypothetical protein
LTPQNAQQIIHRLAELDKEAERFVADPTCLTREQAEAIWHEHERLQHQRFEALDVLFFHQLAERKAGRRK